VIYLGLILAPDLSNACMYLVKFDVVMRGVTFEPSAKGPFENFPSIKNYLTCVGTHSTALRKTGGARTHVNYKTFMIYDIML
jgi:hypothetical protein